MLTSPTRNPHVCACLILIGTMLGSWGCACAYGPEAQASIRHRADNNQLDKDVQTSASHTRPRSVYGSHSGSCPSVCRCWLKYPRKSQHPRQEPVPKLSLDCSSNNLLDFPSPLPRDARVLNMSNNHLQNLTHLPVLPRLEMLDMSFNWLRHMDNRWVYEHSPRLRILR